MSLILWILWIIPSKKGQAELIFAFHISDIPEDTEVRGWLGPKNTLFFPLKANPNINLTKNTKGSSLITLGPIETSISYRRWTRLYIANETNDTAAFVFLPKHEPPRYLLISLSEDINSGLLAPRRRMTETITTSWTGLDLVPGAPIHCN